jgi:hypothetical protein
MSDKETEQWAKDDIDWYNGWLVAFTAKAKAILPDGYTFTCTHAPALGYNRFCMEISKDGRTVRSTPRLTEVVTPKMFKILITEAVEQLDGDG